jgi:hypothetical protein
MCSMLRKRKGPRITHGGLGSRGTNPTVDTRRGGRYRQSASNDSGTDFSTPIRMCNILPTTARNRPQGGLANGQLSAAPKTDN